MKKQSVRLPDRVIAERYKIMLKPDLEEFTFIGEETIFLDIKKVSNNITLHAKDLDIELVEFKNATKAPLIGKVTLDPKSETATFTFPQTLPKGKGELKVVFRGILNDKMRGFYRSQYFVDGKSKHMATTQFEATDARRAFPCFDEPAHKSIFDVTLMIPGHTVAISNTIESEVVEHEGGYKVVKFQPTPKMSTYLLAFIVGEFENIEGKTKDGTVVRIFTTPGKSHQAQFALDVAIRSLEFYNEYFDIPYPLPVLDLIAIPDFSSGAMENWGAVTYRETALLVDAENSSIANKQWVAFVIAHELAHQWFGNLVTMEWWTHLWLNEGFASYMEHLATDVLFPKWGIWDEYVSGRFRHALKLDGLATTHPIEVEVHHPDEIREIFDAVSYAKGSAVIRMLAEYIGDKNFRDGLRYYLKKYAYQNASTEQLWQAFEKVSKKPIKTIMANWTGKPGYPVVSVSQEGGKLKLTQERYFSSVLSQKSNKDKTLWHIPVSYRTDSHKDLQKVMVTKKSEVFPAPKNVSWVKINSGETSVFRSRYTAEDMEKLKDPIQKKKLNARDRVGIIRDAFALAENGSLPTIQVLDLLTSYANEKDYTVWVEIFSGLGTLNQLLYGQPYYEQFRKFCAGLFETITQQVGWNKKDGEPETDALLRSLVLHASGMYGNKEVVQKAQDFFRAFKQSGKKVPADLRSVVYSLVNENGSSKEYQFLVRAYQEEQLQEEKERIARALGKFKNTKILEHVLKFALTKDVRPQDTPFVIASVWVNPVGRELAWNFIKKNWNVFLERYGDNLMMGRVVAAAENFNQVKFAVDVKKFFQKHPAPGAARTIQQIEEKILSNDAWLKRDGKVLRKYFGNQG